MHQSLLVVVAAAAAAFCLLIAIPKSHLLPKLW
jgi:hypothetical protein